MDSFSPNLCEEIQHMSMKMFSFLCETVGTSEEVSIRREMKDIREIVERQIQKDDNIIYMLSGSVREGFRLGGSDLDMMSWPNDHRVICDMSQSEHYYTASKSLILSDSSQSPPGFSLLELVSTTTDSDVQSACVRMNDKLFISSSLYRRNTLLEIRNTKEHGPCGCGEVFGVEYDIAQCFVSDFWPQTASSWIDRCHSWPDAEVVDDIVRNGCHFVPIGNSLSFCECEEWRMSFSMAEYKLVYSMNHCQFLTYGLLKIFLMEVINQQLEESDKLLCSYHTKTANFWAIQQSNISLWCPQNLLEGFWICFNLLLKWVYEGVCPNFFIPQNNMFLSKVHGSAQRSLFLQLHGLYDKGLACLLQSPSIRSYITEVLYNPRNSFYTFHTDLSRIKSEVDYVEEFFYEMPRTGSNLTKYLHHLMKSLHTMEQSLGSPLTPHQGSMLQKLTATILQKTAFILHNMYTNSYPNKQMYNFDKMLRYMLKLAVKFGWIADMVYVGIYYYKTFRYWKALSVLHVTTDQLLQMCESQTNPHVSRDNNIIRQFLLQNLEFPNKICYISELTPEQQSSLENSNPVLYIPLLIMLHFVEFLCYRQVDQKLLQTPLHIIRILVHLDQTVYVDDLYRDITWQILGICEQMTGNLQAALYSYQQSLSQYQCNSIQMATYMRIIVIVGTALQFLRRYRSICL